MECDFEMRIGVLPQDINSARPRTAMGLPNNYAPTLLEEYVMNPKQSAALRANVEQLCRTVENPTVALRQRISAGALLALTGDPRIAPFAPPMIHFSKRKMVLGTAIGALDGLMKEYGKLSLKREWLEKETPEYIVEVKEFSLGKYLITNLEYLHFLRECDEEYLPSSWHLGRYPVEHANHPVFGIRHEWALAYCAWLSDRSGRAFRLPTEIEWESAAAGVERREFPWGSAFSSECANTCECGLLGTSPIGAFPAGQTAEGLFDMGGNVEEFVLDAYAPYPGADVVEDDLYLASGSYPMTRGGCFSRFKDLTRSRRRHGFFDTSLYAYGFRLAEGVA